MSHPASTLTTAIDTFLALLRLGWRPVNELACTNPDIDAVEFLRRTPAWPVFRLVL